MKPPEDPAQFQENVATLALKLQKSQIADESYSLGHRDSGLNHEAIEAAENQAQKELKKPAARKAICEALDSTGDDLKDIAKVTCAALLPLAASGVIAISMTPLAFAVAALIVFRSGVTAYCAEFRDDDI